MTHYEETPDETQVRLERHLAGRFPSTEFEVFPTPRRHGGGDMLVVRWYDGPTEDDVESVSDHYEGAELRWVDEEQVEIPKATVFSGADGSPLWVRAGVVECYSWRRYSRAFIEPIVLEVAEQHGVEPIPVVESRLWGAVPLPGETSSERELFRAVMEEASRRSAE